MKHTTENCLAVLFAIANECLKRSFECRDRGLDDLANLYATRYSNYKTAYDLFKDEDYFKETARIYLREEE